MSTVPGIPTMYAGYRFRSRLEAKWARFFDLAKWQWRYEPIDMKGWIPDFWVSFPCGHSECEFIASKVPNCSDPRCLCKEDAAQRAAEAAWHAKMPFKGDDPELDEYDHWLGNRQFNHWGKQHFNEHFRHELLVEVKPYFSIEEFKGHPVMKLAPYSLPSPAAFGVDPEVTYWQMVHGSGGGIFTVPEWISDWRELWAWAQNGTQWRR